MKPTQLVAIGAGVIAGTAVGWMDVYATEVQGPLLLFMIIAFALSLISNAPAWLLACAVTAGLPIAHMVSQLRGNEASLQASMLVALLPIMLAAYGGRGASRLIGSAAGALVLESQPRGSEEQAWRARPAAPVVLLGIALTGCAVVGIVPVYASNIARAQPFAWWVTLVWQTSTFVAWSLGAPILLRAWQRMHPREAQGVAPKEIVSHVFILMAVAVLHALILPIVTVVLHVPLGTEGAEYAVKWAFAAYLPLDTLTYCLVVGLGHASNATRRLRVAGAQESAARGELAAARLASLQAQLQPHFLFNALNAATVLAKRGDSERAVSVLTKISNLLRYVLRGSERGQGSGSHASNALPLREELAFVESYLDLERERFPDRLAFNVSVGESAMRYLIPHLLLQPLVENAVKHGVGARRALTTITVSAEVRGQSLVIAVRDEGEPSATPDYANESSGIGLTNTRARLASLYGPLSSLSLTRTDGASATAEVVVPLRT